MNPYTLKVKLKLLYQANNCAREMLWINDKCSQMVEVSEKPSESVESSVDSLSVLQMEGVSLHFRS